MNTYEALVQQAQIADSWIDYYERKRDTADFMAEHLPECVLELENPWIFTKSWLRYLQSWYDLPPDTRQTVKDMCHSLWGKDTGVVEIVGLNIEGETIHIDFGIPKEDWRGQ